MAFFFLFLSFIPVMIVVQARKRKKRVIEGYKQRIEKLERRLEKAEGDVRLATRNQLQFLQSSYQEYLSEKKSIS